MYVCFYVCMYVFIAARWSTSTATCNSWIKHSCVGLNHISVSFEYLTQRAESIIITHAVWWCQVATCASGHISHDDISGCRANKLHLKNRRSS